MDVGTNSSAVDSLNLWGLGDLTQVFLRKTNIFSTRQGSSVYQIKCLSLASTGSILIMGDPCITEPPGNYVAPAGISIVFPVIHIHRSASYWEDPMKFDPDRFLPENIAKRHPLSYMPFSAGIRNCIGWRYAMMNLTTLTARIVRELKVFTDYKSLEEVGVELHIFTKIKHGPKVWLESSS